MNLINIIFGVSLLFSSLKSHASLQEDLTSGITKSVVVSTAVYIGTVMGENWAVDIANKSINNVVKSNNLFFEWTVGSVIRGKSLLEALPAAAKQGAKVGAITAAIVSPVICDCFLSIIESGSRTRRYYQKKLRKLTPSAEETPTNWDVVVLGTSTITAGLLICLANKYYR